MCSAVRRLLDNHSHTIARKTPNVNLVTTTFNLTVIITQYLTLNLIQHKKNQNWALICVCIEWLASSHCRSAVTPQRQVSTLYTTGSRSVRLFKTVHANHSDLQRDHSDGRRRWNFDAFLAENTDKFPDLEQKYDQFDYPWYNARHRECTCRTVLGVQRCVIVSDTRGTADVRRSIARTYSLIVGASETIRHRSPWWSPCWLPAPSVSTRTSSRQAALVQEHRCLSHELLRPITSNVHQITPAPRWRRRVGISHRQNCALQTPRCVLVVLWMSQSATRRRAAPTPWPRHTTCRTS